MKTQPDETGSDLGRALKVAKIAANDPSYNDIVKALYADLGEYTPVPETVRNYHNGKVSAEKADLVLLCALAKYYKVKLVDLSPVAAERLKSARKLLSGATPLYIRTAAQAA